MALLFLGMTCPVCPLAKLRVQVPHSGSLLRLSPTPSQAGRHNAYRFWFLYLSKPSPSDFFSSAPAVQDFLPLYLDVPHPPPGRLRQWAQMIIPEAEFQSCRCLLQSLLGLLLPTKSKSVTRCLFMDPQSLVQANSIFSHCSLSLHSHVI